MNIFDRELEWARKNDPAGIASLTDTDGNIVYESYRPNIARLNKAISDLFRGDK